jgi:hypothetical protein
MGKRDREASNAGDAGHAAKRKSSKVQKQAAGAAPKEAAAGAAADAWRPVEAGEDFHTGLDEDGFMGLEVMDAPKIFSTSKPAPASADVGGSNGGATPAAAPGKAGRKAAQAAKEAASAASAPGSDGKQKGKKKRKSSAGAAGAAAIDSTAAVQPASGASPDAAALTAATAAASGVEAASGPAGTAGGGGVDDEVAAALRARLAEKEKRRQQVRPHQPWDSVVRPYSAWLGPSLGLVSSSDLRGCSKRAVIKCASMGTLCSSWL